jgi:exodeoxyribonuclease V gamma subunit
MAFHLHTSNDLRRLAGEMSQLLFAARSSGPGADPFYTDTVVINSRGMESWLLQQLASPAPLADEGFPDFNPQHIPRIQANVRFAMPNALLNFGLLHLDGETHHWHEKSADIDPFDRAVVAWRIYEILGKRASDPTADTYADLRAYISAGGSNHDRRRFQLAREIADVFDQYEVHRPEMLKRWRESAESADVRRSLNNWQPHLWRQLSDVRAQSRDQRIDQFCASPGAVPFDPTQLSRVWVFGVSTLAPCYLAFLRKLGQSMPVHLFVRNPSPSYWYEDRAKSRIQRTAAAAVERGDDPEMLAQVGGDPLLSSFGSLIQDFLDEILDQTGGAVPDTGGLADPSDTSLFAQTPPAATSLLTSLQGGIFTAGIDDAETVIAPDDRSLILHSCHGTVREIEVLRDQLLAWFDDTSTGPDTKLPRNIVIMAPDIEEYVPAIEAVFNRKNRNAKGYIPYTIADRTTAAESAVVQAFLSLLKLPTMRFRASEIFDLLGVDAMARACGLSETDISQLQRWTAAANIRWGLDGAQRDNLGFPALGHANTWQAGTDRLFAGYALSDSVADDSCTSDFAGIVPFNEVEGGSVALLGRMAQFIDDLRKLRGRLSVPRNAGDWCEQLTAVLDQFFVGDNDTYADISAIRRTLEQMTEQVDAAGLTDVLSLPVIESFINGALRTSQSSSLFCRGRVTFCSMLPMRSIPADFIWLLGMNDNAFPRQDPRRDFNLIHSGRRRRCDRSRRLDDRYMFLEAIISARYRLHISYHGRSIQDNAKRPPSAVVRELQNVIGAHLEKVVVEHPLHAFSKRYFVDDPALFSYSSAAESAAAQLYGNAARVSPVLFPDGGLEADADADEPSVDQLAQFFKSPSDYLLRQRLSLYLSGDGETLADDEPIDLGPLDAYSVRQRVVKALSPLVHHDENDSVLAAACDRLCRRLQAEGALPVGIRGARWLSDQWSDVELYLRTPVGVEGCPILADQRLTDVIVAVAEKWPLPGVQLRQRFGSVKAKDEMPALIHHLGALVEAPGADIVTIVAGWNRKSTIAHLFPATVGEIGEGRLADDWAELLQLYRDGLLAPLPFVPSVSFAYARGLATSEEKAMAEADKAWTGGMFVSNYDGLGNLANRYCFGSNSMVGRGEYGGHEFEELAVRLERMWRYWTTPADSRDHLHSTEATRV